MKFGFKETMSGTVKLANGERQFSFTVNVQSGSISRFRKGEPLSMEGTVSIEGIATDRPLTGYLEIGLPLRRRLIYNFSFRGDDGLNYRYYGTKEVRFLQLSKTMTTLVGELYNDSGSIGSATLYFNMNDLPQFLASYRLSL